VQTEREEKERRREREREKGNARWRIDASTVCTYVYDVEIREVGGCRDKWWSMAR